MKKMTILIFFVCGVFFPPVFAQDSLEVSDREFKEMLVSALNHIDSLNEKIISTEVEIGTLSTLITTYEDRDKNVVLDEIRNLSNELDHLKAVKKALWNGLILLADDVHPHPAGLMSIYQIYHLRIYQLYHMQQMFLEKKYWSALRTTILVSMISFQLNV